jgi:hypothetical protein
MASRTQIVCLCEGQKGASIDEVFINSLMKSLKPTWIRQQGSNVVRVVPCGGRKALIEKMPAELQSCLGAGGHTTLMVWADCDHDCKDGDALKSKLWQDAQRQKVTKAQFDGVVFIFAKDRLENWIQFLNTGETNEAEEGPRLKHSKDAADAAKKLANHCTAGKPLQNMPPSLQWSCINWRALVERMK